MDKNGFRAISVFKIIIRVSKKNSEFCGKTSKFLHKRCLFIFGIFYLNKEQLIQQVCLIKYVENEISSSTSHKIKKQKKQAKT